MDKKKNKLKNDIILVFSLLLLVSLAFLGFSLFSKEGTSVKVTIDGKLFGTYHLDTDTSIDIITGNEQENLNRLIIKDGKAYVELATCPDGICSAHKPISKVGTSIICLPHKVVIEVTAPKNENAPDINA